MPYAKDAYFQMDNVLFSQGYFLNYDSKNLTGQIYLDEYQMTRRKDDELESFANPIVQVENQQYHLETLIANHTNIILPNTSYVVFTHQNSILKIDPQYVAIAKPKIIRPQQIRQKTFNFANKYSQQLLNDRTFNEIATLLLELHTPEDPDILNEFKISKSDIIPGVYCNHCDAFTVEKVYRSWLCKQCGKRSNDGHIRALIDYYLLIGPTITNSQCRYFLKLGNTSVAYTFLRSLNLPTDGGRKHRTYKLSLDALLNKLVDQSEYV